ncbi:MAG: adenylate kinase [Lentisphaeria bacterium]|nr:adenylate kinase [Lentisphaeria bacterium]
MVVLLGPPGAGKGTLAESLCAAFGFAHISTGDILREEIRQGTELGRRVSACMESGALVPDDVVTAIVAGRLGQDTVRQAGSLLDGFPRTVRQAELFDRMLASGGMALDRVLLLEADRDLLVRRLTARRVCSQCRTVFNVIFQPPGRDGVCDRCGAELRQRPDDMEATALERLAVYEEQTAPLVAFYARRGVVVRVDAGRAREVVHRDACVALGLGVLSAERDGKGS